MVFVTPAVGSTSRKVAKKFLRSGFIDTLRLHVKGGTGGAGIPRYGGLGGRGGNVYVASKEGISLHNVRKKYKVKKISGGTGGDSSAKGLIGSPGEDSIVRVPPGVSVFTEDGIFIGDANKDGSTLKVAKGGLGGCPETGFCGCKGEARTIVLDLKLIADVGLVGFPNAGKSTFLHAVSNAKPKIANYPFTTMTPKVGLVKYKDHRRIAIADLPGLIEGAHANAGMGHAFLKHLERTKLLLFIVDIQGFQLSQRYVRRTCLETVVSLNKEIELYKPTLLNMPAILIVNKMDTDNADRIYKEIEPHLRDLSAYASGCPEDTRPERVIRFDDIVTASLMQKKRSEIDVITQKIRAAIDRYEEKFASEKYSVDGQFLEKIEKITRRETPTLV